MPASSRLVLSALLASLLVAVPAAAGSRTSVVVEGDAAALAGRQLSADVVEQLAVATAEGEVPGVSVAASSSTSWALAAGAAHRGVFASLTPSHRVRVGSVSKPMMATLALQLVERGVWTLDGTTVGSVIPGVLPQSHESVTVRQVLNHTSGIPSYDAVVETPATSAADAAAFATAPHTDAELLALAKLVKGWTTPGQAWSYSNTNTIVVGMMLVRATGRTLGELLQERIFAPSGMGSTEFPSTVEISFPWASEYLVASSGTYHDVTATHPGTLGAAGNVVSTPSDLNAFWKALFGGRLLRADLVEEMVTPTELSQLAENPYGLGVEAVQVQCSTSTHWSVMVYGHEGMTFGTHTLSFATRDGGFAASASATAMRWHTGLTPVQAWMPLVEHLRQGFCPLRVGDSR